MKQIISEKHFWTDNHLVNDFIGEFVEYFGDKIIEHNLQTIDDVKNWFETDEARRFVFNPFKDKIYNSLYRFFNNHFDNIDIMSELQEALDTILK